jgi:pimeloyl-ACP methyl ester carboxylesterase
MVTVHPIILGGSLQWISLHGNPQHPILLYLHGGPGAAELSTSPWFSQALAKHFCVVNWDQRGAGKSQANTLSVKQLVADCLELLGYLKIWFEPTATYLLGHSWGSLLGRLVLHESPACVDGLICVGLLVSSLQNDVVSHQLALQRAQQNSFLTRLLQFESPPYGQRGGAMLRNCLYVWWLGGLFCQRNLGYALSKTFLWSALYSWQEKLTYLQQFQRSLARLQPELECIEVLATQKVFEVPVVLCVGRHDIVTPLSLAQMFYDSIRAPSKQLVIFEDAAHSLHYEDPHAFARVVQVWQQSIAPVKDDA